MLINSVNRFLNVTKGECQNLESKLQVARKYQAFLLNGSSLVTRLKIGYNCS